MPTKESYAIEELKLPGETLTALIAASSSDLSLIGYCSLAEWNCAVSCLRWLIAILGAPDKELKIRSCKPGDWKLKPIEDPLRRLIPDEFSRTLFEGKYVVEANKLSGLLDGTEPSPCWVTLFSGAYIGSHVCQHFTYASSLEKREEWKGTGLRAEFDVLIYIAGVEEVVKVDGTPILCGFRSALAPIARFEDDSVQWHLIVAKDDDGPFRWIQHRDDFLSLLPFERIRNVEIDRLRGTAYIGWLPSGVPW